MTPIELPTIEVKGPPRELGRAQGEARRDAIRAFAAQRLAAVRDYMADRGSADWPRFVPTGARCLAALERWDPAGYEEHAGIAEAAGVDAGELYAVANMTDVRDIVLLSAGSPAGDEGCSAIMLPPAFCAASEVIAGQTWDLNPQDLDYIVAVHRRPDEGPQTWSVTCVGCPSLVAINEHGLSLGTTNIKVRGSRVGVGYLSIIHRAIRARDRETAGEIVRGAPRAAAHTYWVADPTGVDEYECSSERCVERSLGDEPLARTNHCFEVEHVSREGEEPNSSSRTRLRRLGELLGRGNHDVDSLRALYADRGDGLDSINRYAEDDTGTATNACLLCFPSRRVMWACKGPSDRGRWVELAFA